MIITYTTPNDEIGIRHDVERVLNAEKGSIDNVLIQIVHKESMTMESIVVKRFSVLEEHKQ